MTGNSEFYFAPTECSGDGSISEISPVQTANNIGYDAKESESVPEPSILGVGCGTPVSFADINECDIGSGGWIDVFLSANKVKDSGKVLGIDMTNEMLEKARYNAKQSGFTNVEFKKGDIEWGIPIEDSAADVFISNCVINLTLDKVIVFERTSKNKGEISRLLESLMPNLD